MENVVATSSLSEEELAAKDCDLNSPSGRVRQKTASRPSRQWTASASTSVRLQKIRGISTWRVGPGDLVQVIPYIKYIGDFLAVGCTRVVYSCLNKIRYHK